LSHPISLRIGSASGFSTTKVASCLLRHARWDGLTHRPMCRRETTLEVLDRDGAVRETSGKVDPETRAGILVGTCRSRITVSEERISGSERF